VAGENVRQLKETVTTRQLRRIMTTKTFTVPNISCGHCTHTIEMELSDLAGVQSVQADKDTRQVTVAWEEPASWEKIRVLLQEINYPPEGLIQLC